MRRFLIAAFLLFPFPVRGEQVIATGELTHVIVAHAPAQSYELYLPSNYNPNRRWPIVYIFDARQRGKHAAERFIEAAERYGYILASSNNTLSDGPFEPIETAYRAMRSDSFKRVSIDPARIYLAGFSGTARAAYALAATSTGGRVAGVIGASGGLPESIKTPTTEIAYFATAGTVDFNYLEMKALDQLLADQDVPHALEIFEGGHEWPPTETATHAIEWLHVHSLRAGVATIDERDLQAIAARWAATALTLEQKDVLRAVALYGEVTEHFGVVTSTVTTRATQLVRSKAYKKAARSEQKSLAWEARQRARLGAILAQNASPRMNMPNEENLLQRLGVAALHRQAAEGDVARARAAARLLAHLRSDAAFYLPRKLDQSDPERARFYRTFAEKNLILREPVKR